ncbi:RDD family protein [Cytobacillus dafuensis]|uniref:RDD family protein n=1 Tax=Cytobacillus dafuensis TaxID=1742359 RepID=A0A5B8Z295_CYTDA|nr:RDD family protein [Cytobacillus dafuensis]QED46981.1 RDD family protein [Cytobacillus dafuensis]
MDRKPAGFGVRLLADLFDFFLLTIPISLVFFYVKGEYSYDWASGWTWQVIYTLYLMSVPIVWSGYIIGKRIFKIKVKRTDEDKLALKDMFLREVVGKFILVYLTVGLSSIASVFMVIFREDKRAVHDLIAGTYVSYER